MKLLLAAACAAGCIAITAPAFAQDQWNLDKREEWTDHLADSALRDGAIDPNQSAQIHQRVADVRAKEREKMHNGTLTPGDMHMLESDLDQMIDEIRWDKADHPRRPW
jgi:hypothetical protein